VHITWRPDMIGVPISNDLIAEHYRALRMNDEQPPSGSLPPYRLSLPTRPFRRNIFMTRARLTGAA